MNFYSYPFDKTRYIFWFFPDFMESIIGTCSAQEYFFNLSYGKKIDIYDNIIRYEYNKNNKSKYIIFLNKDIKYVYIIINCIYNKNRNILSIWVNRDMCEYDNFKYEEHLTPIIDNIINNNITIINNGYYLEDFYYCKDQIPCFDNKYHTTSKKTRKPFPLDKITTLLPK